MGERERERGRYSIGANIELKIGMWRRREVSGGSGGGTSSGSNGTMVVVEWVAGCWSAWM